MPSKVTLNEFAKDNFKHTSFDLEGSLAEVEKICCGLGSSECSENLYALLERARQDKVYKNYCKSNYDTRYL